MALRCLLMKAAQKAVLLSNYTANTSPPATSPQPCEVGGGLSGRQSGRDTAGCYGIGQDLYHGQCDTGPEQADPDHRPQ